MRWSVKERLLTVETTRYSEFFRRVLEEYCGDTVATIDGQRYCSDDFPDLMEWWCINEKIKSTQDFRLKRGRKELFGFHDDPLNIWGAASERAFLQKLADEKLIRLEFM